MSYNITHETSSVILFSINVIRLWFAEETLLLLLSYLRTRAVRYTRRRRRRRRVVQYRKNIIVKRVLYYYHIIIHIIYTYVYLVHPTRPR